MIHYSREKYIKIVKSESKKPILTFINLDRMTLRFDCKVKSRGQNTLHNHGNERVKYEADFYFPVLRSEPLAPSAFRCSSSVEFGSFI